MLSLAAFLAGCGTDDYQSQLDQAVTGSAKNSPFAVLGPDTKIPDSTITLRLPPSMQSVDINGRGKFPGSILEVIDGLKATYEGYWENKDAKTKQYFYLYIAVTEAPSNGFMPIQYFNQTLAQKQFSAAESSTSINKNMPIAGPDGTSKPFDEVHFVKGKQPFPIFKQGSEVIQEELGDVICLSRVDNGKVYSIIYRYPSNFANQHTSVFDCDWVKYVAGTMKTGE
jgi:hypothetical protein